MNIEVKEEHLTEGIMMVCVAAVLITLIITTYLYVSKVAPNGLPIGEDGHHAPAAQAPVIVLPPQSNMHAEVWHG